MIGEGEDGRSPGAGVGARVNIAVYGHQTSFPRGAPLLLRSYFPLRIFLIPFPHFSLFSRFYFQVSVLSPTLLFMFFFSFSFLSPPFHTCSPLLSPALLFSMLFY